ncbi:MAG: elongation factor P [Actinobacteria bacterium]|nr:elongation factor P [Actinomycetota bacterium]
MIKAVDLRRGVAVRYRDDIWTVVDFQHVAKGNKRSLMQVKLKNLTTGSTIDERFRVSDSLEDVFVDKRQMEYSYSTADNHFCMDSETYEQVPLGLEVIGDGIGYLVSGTPLEVHFFDGKAATAILPNTVDLKVTDAPPAVKGATATNQNKTATLETGITVQVPPFVEMGEVVRVDTRSGEYVERVR